MTETEKDAELERLRNLIKEKENYIDYLEKLSIAQSNVLSMSDEERKVADMTIKAYEQLQQITEQELREKDSIIRAHENLMNLSSNELLHKNAIFHNILEINQYISTILEEEVVLKKTMENLIKAMHFERGVLYILENGKLVPKIFINFHLPEKKPVLANFLKEILKRLIKEKKRIFIKNEELNNGLQPQKITALCLPLLSKEKLLGAIYTDIISGESILTEHDLEIAEIFSTQAIISLKNVILYRMLKKEAITDRFTGLPNRRKLEIDAEVPGYKLLALLNIDNFSSINMAYGLEVGNHVLKTMATRLKMVLTDNSTLYRLSGDEFVILTRDQSITPHMLSAAIMNAVCASPIVYEDIAINISISIGLVQNEDDNILRKADIALKIAKKRGNGYVELYKSQEDFINRYKQIFVWVNKVKEAVQQNRLLPYFQGIRNNATGRLEIFECLVRITDKENKVLSPKLFLGPAKQVGLYSTVSFCMIDKSFQYFRDKPYAFALNLSYEDFCNQKLIDYIALKIEELKIPANRIIFEVLEEVSQQRDALAFEFIKKLQKLGVKIAIDDFGVEYSNFSHLLSIQVDYIKISGFFTRKIAQDKQNLKIVKAITDFAHSIGTKVIAEHVFSETIQQKVLELGIDYSQGNLFSKPAPQIPSVPLSG